jgi:GH43 family beta-xylosidase
VKPANTNTYTNPLLTHAPDPWAIWHEGKYYYIRSNGSGLFLLVTADITDLKNAEQKQIWTPTDPANSKNLWAPEIHRLYDKWYVYYAADDGNTDNHQMYCLENSSDNPFEGEFVMKGRISTDKDSNWAIDGSIFEHKGELYFIWSGWQKRRVSVETQCIYIARMENPWTLSTDRLLISKPDQCWERRYVNDDNSQPGHIIYVNEGPQALVSPAGKYVHIVYSASGCWSQYYCLGLLTAKCDDDLMDAGSWLKSSAPVFEQSPENGVYGTGHNCFLKSPDGTEDYIIYHARSVKNDPPGTPDTRSPYLQKFTWDANDYPVFGKPLPASAILVKPSGTK